MKISKKIKTGLGVACTGFLLCPCPVHGSILAVVLGVSTVTALKIREIVKK